MGKRPYSQKPSGIERSSMRRFENTIGIDPKRIGGKKVKNPEDDAEEPWVEEIPSKETVLYLAPVAESKPSFGEKLMRGFLHIVRGERL